MITGDIKNKIDQIWDTFFVAGITNPIKHLKSSMINGYDTDQTMLRIGAMNLLLHDVTAPELAWRDSLSADNDGEISFWC